MLVIRSILGEMSDEKTLARRVERVLVNASDACKRRCVCRTDAGTEILIDLERGNYLFHGAVLVNETSRIIVIERLEEDAVIVELASYFTPTELLAQSARLAHAFGNLHLPLEIVDYELRAPMTTSRDVVSRTVAQLELRAVKVRFAGAQLGLYAPLLGSGLAHK